MKEDVDRTRELGLPASVILIDSPWTTGYNSYDFNPKQFADAPGMIRHLHESGYKLVLWHTSWINNHSNPPGEAGFEGKLDETSSNYAEAAGNNYFVKNSDGSPWVGTWWKGKGSLIDFTNPSAKLWWQGQVGKAVKAGADGFKDDDAEGAFLSPTGTSDVKFADGSDVRLMRNRYGTLYNDAMEEVVLNQLKGNGVLFARSVTTGALGTGFLWGGDNEANFSTENGFPHRRHRRHLGRHLGHAALGSRHRGVPQAAGHPEPSAARTLDRICRVYAFDGSDVVGQHRALDLR